MSDETLSRRDLVVAGVGSLAAGGLACRSKEPTMKQPVVFVPHGGGPWPWMEEVFGDARENAAMRKYLESLAGLPKTPPKALLVISAHWEESSPTLMTGDKPPLLFDYYGFPPETYKLTWPAPGAPQLVERVDGLLKAAGFKVEHDNKRGFDHGTFVPLKLAYPTPTVPVLQLSLKKGLDPAEHLAMGRALAPLRDEGVYIVGSGMTFHNMRGFGNPQAATPSKEFDLWLQATTKASAPDREKALTEWAKAPAARFCHPREEHLLPLMVIAGAAGGDVGSVPYADTYTGLSLSAHQFG